MSLRGMLRRMVRLLAGRHRPARRRGGASPGRALGAFLDPETFARRLDGAGTVALRELLARAAREEDPPAVLLGWRPVLDGGDPAGGGLEVRVELGRVYPTRYRERLETSRERWCLEAGAGGLCVTERELEERREVAPGTLTERRARTHPPGVLAMAAGELSAARERTGLGALEEAATASARELCQGWLAAWRAGDAARLPDDLPAGLRAREDFWLRAYREAELRRRIEPREPARMRVVRLACEAGHDLVVVAAEVRLCDQSVDAEGALVWGTEDLERRFTAYWTLARPRGARDPLGVVDLEAPGFYPEVEGPDLEAALLEPVPAPDRDLHGEQLEELAGTSLATGYSLARRRALLDDAEVDVDALREERLLSPYLSFPFESVAGLHPELCPLALLELLADLYPRFHLSRATRRGDELGERASIWLRERLRAADVLLLGASLPEQVEDVGLDGVEVASFRPGDAGEPGHLHVLAQGSYVERRLEEGTPLAVEEVLTLEIPDLGGDDDAPRPGLRLHWVARRRLGPRRLRSLWDHPSRARLRAPRPDRDLPARLEELAGEDPALGEEGLRARLEELLPALHRAAATGDRPGLEAAAGGALAATLSGWAELHRERGLDCRIEAFELIRAHPLSLRRFGEELLVDFWVEERIDHRALSGTGEQIRGRVDGPETFYRRWTMGRRNPAEPLRLAAWATVPEDQP